MRRAHVVPPSFRQRGMEPTQHEITQLLQQVSDGDRTAIDRLLPLVYDQLRRMAHQQRLRWQGEETLNTTALVHEAYIRLAGGSTLDLESRKHFLRVAARAMRYILLDHAKAKKRQKRGGDRQRVPLDEALRVTEREADELIALNDALDRLRAMRETAMALGVSPATVKRGWQMARAWLHREMQGRSGASAHDDAE